MTDPTTPTDDDLSLALDGEADAEVLARIEASPEAQARLEELRAAASLVGAPVAALDDDTVDDLIGAALDTPIAPPRVARGERRRATPWLVAASVVLLMAVGLSLVWAGRGSEDDQAGASRTAADQPTERTGAADADSNFSDSGASSGDGSAESATTVADGADAAPLANGHGTDATVAPSTSGKLPVLYLGSYDDADALRSATAASFADAWKASGSELNYDTGSNTRTTADAPAAKAVDRCAQQLQITLSLKAGPLQTGFATVDDQQVLVYEFAAASARDGKETTLVAAVGPDACDEVVIFER